MNVLENYIKEVHGVKEYKDNPEWITVDVTIDCYGITQRVQHFVTKEDWEKEKAQGFFLA